MRPHLQHTSLGGPVHDGKCGPALPSDIMLPGRCLHELQAEPATPLVRDNTGCVPPMLGKDVIHVQVIPARSTDRPEIVLRETSLADCFRR